MKNRMEKRRKGREEETRSSLLIQDGEASELVKVTSGVPQGVSSWATVVSYLRE